MPEKYKKRTYIEGDEEFEGEYPEPEDNSNFPPEIAHKKIEWKDNE